MMPIQRWARTSSRLQPRWRPASSNTGQSTEEDTTQTEGMQNTGTRDESPSPTRHAYSQLRASNDEQHMEAMDIM